MLANVDKLNEATREIVPLQETNSTELIKQLYDDRVDIDTIILTYHALDEFYDGQARHEWDRDE
jgi:hypothetical protein